MILIDTGQAIYSTLFQNMKNGFDEAMARNMVYVTLLSFKKKFHEDFGDPVLAFDSESDYWRKQVFPPYKHRRQKDKENGKIDWEMIYAFMNKIIPEIKEVVPWKNVQIHGAEADDVIGILGKNRVCNPTVILSSDKDYKQLHENPLIRQYSPIMKKWVTTSDPKKSLLELIANGDSGDGVPNILSQDDSFVIGKRQKPITEKWLTEMLKDPGRLYRENKENYERNDMLVNFDRIPEHIKTGILEEFNTPVTGSINKLYKYFVANRMSGLLGNIEQFKTKGVEYGVHAEIGVFR